MNKLFLLSLCVMLISHFASSRSLGKRDSDEQYFLKKYIVNSPTRYTMTLEKVDRETPGAMTLDEIIGVGKWHWVDEDDVASDDDTYDDNYDDVDSDDDWIFPPKK